MGAWGVGHFENDDAQDWAEDLNQADSLDAVEEAIEAVEAGGDYLEAPDACVGLAAAEVVAATLGNPADDLPDPIATAVARLEDPADEDLVARARAAVERVIGEDSELRELWEESDDFDAWESTIQDLLARLAG
ncbi:MAG: DUF4259 domain-containing protein [Pseudomonadota bacterium]